MINLTEIIGGAGGIKPWVSGATIKRYAYVVSPTDLEVYQRKTATGSGATDPYSDTTNYRPASFDRVSSITNAWSAGGTSPGSASDFLGYVTAPTPAFSAGVRTAVLNISGRSSLRFFAVQAGAAVSGSVRLEILLDGRTVFDVTSSAYTASGNFSIGAGYVAGALSSVNIPGFDDFRCSNSLQVYITCSNAQSAGVVRPKYAYQSYQN